MILARRLFDRAFIEACRKEECFREAAILEVLGRAMEAMQDRYMSLAERMVALENMRTWLLAEGRQYFEFEGSRTHIAGMSRQNWEALMGIADSMFAIQDSIDTTKVLLVFARTAPSADCD